MSFEVAAELREASGVSRSGDGGDRSGCQVTGQEKPNTNTQWNLTVICGNTNQRLYVNKVHMKLPQELPLGSI